MKTDFKKFEQELRAGFSGEVYFDNTMRGLYATDASNYQIMPIAVVVPRDEEDVIRAVNVATNQKVSILPRGAGTSLAGQTVSDSLVIDFSKYMNNIVEINLGESWARVQPGIVLDELNFQLQPTGLHFAPDPATSSRANIGGMIGNNSSGTKSIIYGKTVDNILEVKVLLSTGEVVILKEFSDEEYEEQSLGNSRYAQILRDFRQLVEANRVEIKERFPKVMRRVNGYNLDEFVRTDDWNLAKIFVGSEGTLGVLLEAKIILKPIPPLKYLCVVHFNDLFESVRAVEPILETGPSAVEILDQKVIHLARNNLNTAVYCDFIQGDPAAVLIVEYFGDTPIQAEEKLQKLLTLVKNHKLGYAAPVFRDSPGQEKAWAVRKNGLGLLDGMKGRKKPREFVEDVCVPIEVLANYVEDFFALCHEHQTELALFGHASVGVIHLKPILDLHQADDIEKMKKIAEGVFQLTLKYHGALSGEHGDGLVRSPFMEQFYGPKLYQAFKTLKRLFDPLGLMNPGKIVEAGPMDQNLRYGTRFKALNLNTLFHYREDENFESAVEMCTGVGACRKNLGGTMCPSYMVTRDEKHSTRARANALRLALSGQWGEQGISQPAVLEVMDLCLSCKGCKAECPSNVDLAKLKSETLQAHYDRNGATLRDKMIARSPSMAQLLSGWKALFVNFFQDQLFFRFMMEKLAGIDRRRTLPAYSTKKFSVLFKRRNHAQSPSVKTVVLFNDTYMNFHEPKIGMSAVRLLEDCGYTVILANAGCCQRPRISHGFLRDAKKEGEKTYLKLESYIDQGFPILTCEPSCASALTDDLADLIDDAVLCQKIRRNVFMIDQFLAQEQNRGRLTRRFKSRYKKILIHGHCHQKALYGTAAMKRILRQDDTLQVTEIDSGCCGMAGSFGYEKEHYEISKKIGERRLFPAIRNAERDAAIIACGFSCRHQIYDFTRVQAKHWVETVAVEN